ncbi:hypothetical protein SPHINGOAX6_30096 [Sphingomonas sp. AX6]|nr:hypothetical protein SPHINGOAX6_30096 [Sphingomonas sp. AX6]
MSTAEDGFVTLRIHADCKAPQEFSIQTLKLAVEAQLVFANSCPHAVQPTSRARLLSRKVAQRLTTLAAINAVGTAQACHFASSLWAFKWLQFQASLSLFLLLI